MQKNNFGPFKWFFGHFFLRKSACTTSATLTKGTFYQTHHFSKKGPSPKYWLLPQKRFFWGGPNEKLWPRVNWWYALLTKIAVSKQKMTLGIFGILGQMLAFLAHLMSCPTNKTMWTRCLGGFLIGGYQSDCPLPKKLGFLAQKRPNLAKICIFGYFGPNIGFSGPFNAMLDQKKIMRTRCLGGFLICWYQTFCSLPK